MPEAFGDLRLSPQVAGAQFQFKRLIAVKNLILARPGAFGFISLEFAPRLAIPFLVPARFSARASNHSLAPARLESFET